MLHSSSARLVRHACVRHFTRQLSARVFSTESGIATDTLTLHCCNVLYSFAFPVRCLSSVLASLGHHAVSAAPHTKLYCTLLGQIRLLSPVGNSCCWHDHMPHAAVAGRAASHKSQEPLKTPHTAQKRVKPRLRRHPKAKQSQQPTRGVQVTPVVLRLPATYTTVHSWRSSPILRRTQKESI